MRFLLFLFLLVSTAGSAQWKDFMISVRGDTLNRVDMNNMKQGPWVIHVAELRGEPGYDEQGYFMDDMKVDLWIKFTTMGDKIAAENYRWGRLNGKARYFTRTGGLVREEMWRAIEPGKAFDTVDVFDLNDPTKVVDRAIVKVEGHSVKHGVWTYYDPEWGTIQRTENWWMDKRKNEDGSIAGEGGDDLKPLDPKGANKEKKELAKPQAILDYEKKNSGKKKIKMRDGSTGN